MEISAQVFGLVSAALLLTGVVCCVLAWALISVVKSLPRLKNSVFGEPTLRDAFTEDRNPQHTTAQLRMLDQRDEIEQLQRDQKALAQKLESKLSKEAFSEVITTLEDFKTEVASAFEDINAGLREPQERMQEPPQLSREVASAFGTSPMDTAPVSPATVEKVVAAATGRAPREDLSQLDPERKRLRLLLRVAQETVGDKQACCNCTYWDQDEGQSAMLQHPVFAQAAKHILPSRMGVKVAVDEQGDKLPDDQQPAPIFPAKLDKWELFGACLKHNNLLHATDSCPDFAREA